MTEKPNQCRNGQPHWCGGVYYPIDGCVDRPHVEEPPCLCDGGEGTPCPAHNGQQPKCPTCGSVDGVALWRCVSVTGEVVRNWHLLNEDWPDSSDDDCEDHFCPNTSCAPCPTCSAPKQEQPKAGLLTPLQAEAESGQLSREEIQGRLDFFDKEEREGRYHLHHDIGRRLGRAALAALIENANLREQNSVQGDYVFSLEGKVKRLQDAIVLLSDYGEGECWCDIMSQSEDSPHTKICIAAREALKE